MGKLFRELSEYAELRFKSYKLTAVEQLSIILSKALALVIFILLLGIALLLFTVALTLFLGYLTGSMIWAAVIIGGVYVIVALLFFIFRGSVFSDSMVKVLCNIMFPDKEGYDEYVGGCHDDKCDIDPKIKREEGGHE